VIVTSGSELANKADPDHVAQTRLRESHGSEDDTYKKLAVLSRPDCPLNY